MLKRGAAQAASVALAALGRSHARCFSAASGTDSLVRLGFIGAGGVNFGTPEGVWNHAKRLEPMPNLQFTHIIDPNLELARKRIEEHGSGPYGAKWRACEVFPDYHSMLSSGSRPDAVIIGVPPDLHGSFDVPSAAMERDLAQAGLHMLIEKPISMRPAEEVERLAQELDRLGSEKDVIIAVGYMLRYNPAIEAAQALLQEIGRQPTSIVGRYNCTYNTISKPQWWDTLKSGGCIVEQATHFVDAMRYLSKTEIKRDSILALGVGPEMPLLHMADAPAAEHKVPKERRVNRATLAIFEFDSSALGSSAHPLVGSLSHSLLLHGSNFFTELDILGDGFHILIKDPYQNPHVLVRRPLSNDYEQVPLDTSKDMYEKQFEAFLTAVRTGDKSLIRCHYHDAARTYEASWWISAAAGSPVPDGSMPPQ